MSKHRNYASDSVKFLNQATIERLLGDDNCYSQSSGEYDEVALKERLIELKTAKAERIGGRGYDEMLVNEEAQQGSSGDVVGMFAARPRYVSIPVPDSVKIKVKQKTIKFIIRW
jgi:hypothetical protein